jgi:hypothetical protein
MYSNSRRVTAVGETLHFVVLLGSDSRLEIQHIGSREVLWVNEVNIGTVLEEWWMIFWGELTRIFFVALHLHHVTDMSLIPFGK